MLAPHCSSTFEQSQLVLATAVDETSRPAAASNKQLNSLISDFLCVYSYIVFFCI
jgi:hypothetical protein